MKQMWGSYYPNHQVSNPNPAWAFGFFASPENLYSITSPAPYNCHHIHLRHHNCNCILLQNP